MIHKPENTMPIITGSITLLCNCLHCVAGISSALIPRWLGSELKETLRTPELLGSISVRSKRHRRRIEHEYGNLKWA